jgi:FixJ family two-component response regulator
MGHRLPAGPNQELSQIKARRALPSFNPSNQPGRHHQRARATTAMTSYEPALGHPVVVVVDDDAAVRGSLKFALEIEGFCVRTYPKGDDLLGDLQLGDCACFIIDQMLPGMTGLDVVAALRRGHIAAPVILITSHPTNILQERAARAGVPIVEKPLLGNALIDHVRYAIAHPPTTH